MKWTMATKAAVNTVAAICLVGMLASCADDIRYREIQGQIPPVQPGYARIYLYTMSPTVDPGFEFSVDGKVVGSTTGYNVLYVDRPAGPVRITLNSKRVFPSSPPAELPLQLSAGETQYVEGEKDPTFTNPQSVHVRLLVIDPKQAATDLHDTFYVGPALPRAKS